MIKITNMRDNFLLPFSDNVSGIANNITKIKTHYNARGII